MIGIVRTLPRSRGHLGLKNDREDFMNLPLFFHGLTKPASIWPAVAVRPALLAAAAIAGYATFMSLQASKAPATAIAEQPRWVGQFEKPVAEAMPQSAPATSASYILPDTASTGGSAKKIAPLPTVAPKVVAKTAVPPRRPDEINKPVAVASITPSATALPGPAAPMPPALIPTAEAAPPAPRRQNLLSRVTDRLPEKGTLLKPLGLMGDAVHSLVKFF
jgi:hypothetical protein